MRKISYSIKRGTIMGYADAAILGEGDDPATQVAQAAIQTLSTEIEITAGGVTMHLAGWLDPWHWEDDWNEMLDGTEFDDYVSGLIEEVEPL